VLNPFKLSFFSNQSTFTTIPAGQGQRSKVTSAAVALWILEASNQVTLLNSLDHHTPAKTVLFKCVHEVLINYPDHHTPAKAVLFK